MSESKIESLFENEPIWTLLKKLPIVRFSWQYREAHVNGVYLIGAALLLVCIVVTSMWAHQLSVVVSSAVAAIRPCTGFFLYCLELNFKRPMCSQTYWCYLNNQKQVYTVSFKTTLDCSWHQRNGMDLGRFI